MLYFTHGNGGLCMILPVFAQFLLTKFESQTDELLSLEFKIFQTIFFFVLTHAKTPFGVFSMPQQSYCPQKKPPVLKQGGS